jgi:hypothetical protein
VQAFLSDPKFSQDAKLRVVLLYALRYEKTPNNSSATFMHLLQGAGLSESRSALVQSIIKYAGADFRLEDIFLNSDILSRTKNALKGLKGVDNVYAQHVPRISQVVTDCIRGKLKDVNYPFLEGGTRDKPQDLIVFVIGGTTYSEAREVANLNASNPGSRIILGGTSVINTSLYTI